MKVRLTEAQAIAIATNAINASSPIGMGFLQFEDKDYTEDEVAETFENGEDKL